MQLPRSVLKAKLAAAMQLISVSFLYSRIGVQKRMEQTAQPVSRRISILGLWQPNEHSDYALAQSGFKSASYIKARDWQAEKAAQTLAQTGQFTVVVQDNGPIHKVYFYSCCPSIAHR